MKITKTAIDRMEYAGDPVKKTQDIRWDDQIPGFGVRIWPSGKKTFLVRYRQGGRRRYLTLGRYGVLTLAQARERAQVKLADVLDGDDPAEQKRREALGETFGDLAELYIERYAKSHKKTWTKDKQQLDDYVLPAWRNHRVASITRTDVSQLFHKIGGMSECSRNKKREKGLGGPVTANRVLQMLSKMFNLAIEWGFLEETAANPAARIKKYPEKKRERFVTTAEMPKLAQAIKKEDNVFVRAAIWLYLLTGLRKQELLRITWDDVYLESRELAIRDTKQGKPHYVPLSQPASKILEKIPRLMNNPYVFCGRRSGQPLVNIDKPWRRVREEAALEDVWLHDLRRTVGSWLAQSGSSLPLIGQVLGHSNPSTTQIYARFHKDPVAKALEEHGERVEELMPEDDFQPKEIEPSKS